MASGNLLEWFLFQGIFWAVLTIFTEAAAREYSVKLEEKIDDVN